MNRILVGVCFIIGFVIEIIRMAITDEINRFLCLSTSMIND